MANTGSAAKAVQLELQHARQGMMYYSKLVENLEDVLETLAAIEAPATESRTRRGRSLTGRKAEPKAASTTRQKADLKPATKSKLPSTGKDFWPSLLTDTPQSASDVFKAAVAALGIRPSAEDKKKLNQRLSNALSVLSKNGEINAEGHGRDRRYTRKTSTAS
ncbi:hypothetical protein RY831_32055 [Noviherbaspirillum sp. CPCC 100848]|uniref:Uncharacterized protein n=1 Tax=Noviherbaspirillum album TaxID=3080276 RepID=A0ABU6JJA8_9BURK|nr:hypothetical protein [Noviherbaspirillum sp. CPCC 100848]MEC4723759.1 hypothetical protein [Noviherbaspirillum sp. CPCC 100848]